MLALKNIYIWHVHTEPTNTKGFRYYNEYDSKNENAKT